MRIMCLVNDPAGIGEADSTCGLLDAALARGHEAWACGIADMGFSPEDTVTAFAVPLLGDARVHGDRQRVEIGSFDCLLLRTNPARDTLRAWAHKVCLCLARLAQNAGVIVVNDPSGLEVASSKLYLETLPPEFRPRTLVSRDRKEIRAFIEDLQGPGILKPLEGTHGQDVFLLPQQGRTNMNQIIEVLTRSGFAMAQEFLPQAVDGDVRLLVLEGRPLRAGDAVAAVRRVPGGRDFRSNIHAGGYPAPAEFTPQMAEICAAVGPRLNADGIFLAGLDIIGDKVVEINVFSPGGFRDAGRFGGADFTQPVIAALEARVAARAAKEAP